MARVTDKQYYMEDYLKHNLDLMIKRSTGNNKADNLVLIDGDEGTGKSNLAVAVGYYVGQATGRKFSVDNVHFDLDQLMNKAINSKDEIFIWDEGALGGLATEWWNKNQKKFLKLLMVARKRRHFWVICIPKFFKMNEYIVLDRSIALLHTYLKDGITHGSFCYFNKKKKEKLYHDWRKSKYRNYVKHFSFRGYFPEVLPLLIDENEYERKKDVAIMSIDKEDDKLDERSFRKNLVVQAIMKMMIRNKLPPREELCQTFSFSITSIDRFIAEAKKLIKKGGTGGETSTSNHPLINNMENKGHQSAQEDSEDEDVNYANLSEQEDEQTDTN